MSRLGRGRPARALIFIVAATSNQNINNGDTGFGNEVAQIDVASGDFGFFADDDLDIQIPAASADTGSFVEALADRTFTAGDTGSGVEQPIGAEFGTFSEAVPSLGNSILNADTGSGVDVHVSLAIVSTDSGTAVDTHTDRALHNKDLFGTTTELGVVGSANPSSADAGHFTETTNLIDRGAPPFRTYTIPAENRVRTVEAEVRTYEVPAEDRVKVMT